MSWHITAWAYNILEARIWSSLSRIFSNLPLTHDSWIYWDPLTQSDHKHNFAAVLQMLMTTSLDLPGKAADLMNNANVS